MQYYGLHHKDAYDEGRIMILRVSTRWLLSVVTGWNDPVNGPTIINMCDDCVPDDASVVSINVDWASNSVLLKLCHPSFDPVPEGSEVPVHIVMGYNSVPLVEIIHKYEERIGFRRRCCINIPGAGADSLCPFDGAIANGLLEGLEQGTYEVSLRRIEDGA